MQANKFDALLQKRYEEYQPEYNTAAWTALAEKLPPVQSSRRSYALWSLGLGLAASVAVACIFILHRPALQHTVAGLSVRRTPNRPLHVVTKPPIFRSKITAGKFMIASKAIIGNSSNNQGVPVIAFLDESIIPPSPQPVTTQQDVQVYADPKEKNPMPLALDVSEQHAYLEYPIFKATSAEGSEVTKTIISMAGGVQYGSLNGGYAAGINVQQKLNSRWYAEAEIGYQHYTASGTHQLTATDYNSVTSGSLGFIGSDSARSKLKSNQVVQYIQASPGIGYHLSKKVRIGAGVDFQRALQSSDEKAVLVEGNDLKLLPLLDVGATGSVSFRLSDWLEAGLLYRQGVNNILQSRQLYLVRQYLQVQLTVPLIKR